MLLTKNNYINYLGNQRIAVIQKAHDTIHTRVQMINNRLVDKKVKDIHTEITRDVYDPFSESAIFAEINGYNRIATSQDIQRILQHSLVKRNPQTTLEATKVLNNVSESLTQIETRRIMKNLDYIEKALQNVDIEIGKYNAIIEKLPQTTSRKEVLARCIQTGEDLPASKREAFLRNALRQGENYKGRQYDYRELKQLSRDLERYKSNRLDYETAIMENKQSNREGYGDLNATKTWIWSQLEKTRHSGMDGETIPLTSKFEVVNEQTGAVDFLRFPGDVENDHNNCSNICNCQCTYEINKGDN